MSWRGSSAAFCWRPADVTPEALVAPLDESVPQSPWQGAQGEHRVRAEPGAALLAFPQPDGNSELAWSLWDCRELFSSGIGGNLQLGFSKAASSPTS